MSILMEVLEEELERLDRQEAAYERELQELPKGYISKKIIQGKEYYYLQRKEGGKVVSKYISAESFPAVDAQVKKRKQLDASLRRVRADQKKLRKALGV